MYIVLYKIKSLFSLEKKRNNKIKEKEKCKRKKEIEMKQRFKEIVFSSVDKRD